MVLVEHTPFCPRASFPSVPMLARVLRVADDLGSSELFPFARGFRCGGRESLGIWTDERYEHRETCDESTTLARTA